MQYTNIDKSSPAQALPAEFALLCACCSVESGREDRIRRLLETPFDGARLVRAAVRNHITGLVFRALQRPDFQNFLTEDARLALSRETEKQQRLCTRLTLETQLVHQVLYNAGIAALFPKGVALSLRLYGEIDARHYRDVDVCIAQDRLFDACSALKGADYRQFFPEEIVFTHRDVPAHSVDFRHPARGNLIGLQWKLTDNPVLARGIGPDPGDIATVAQPLPGGGELRTLPDEELLCFLAVHGATHGWTRLKDLADIAQLIPEIDGLPAIIDRARTRGMIRPLALALILCRDLMGWEMPRAVAARLPQGGVVKTLVRRARATLILGAGNDDPVPPRCAAARMYVTRLKLARGPRHVLCETGILLRDVFVRTRPADLPPVLIPFWPLMRITRWLRDNVKR